MILSGVLISVGDKHFRNKIPAIFTITAVDEQRSQKSIKQKKRAGWRYFPFHSIMYLKFSTETFVIFFFRLRPDWAMEKIQVTLPWDLLSAWVYQEYLQQRYNWPLFRRHQNYRRMKHKTALDYETTHLVWLKFSYQGIHLLPNSNFGRILRKQVWVQNTCLKGLFCPYSFHTDLVDTVTVYKGQKIGWQFLPSRNPWSSAEASKLLSLPNLVDD